MTRVVDEMVAALGCPLADDDSVALMNALAPPEVLRELQLWLGQVFGLNPRLTIAWDAIEETSDSVGAVLSVDGTRRTSSLFRVVSQEDLQSTFEDSELLALADADTDVTVLCLNAPADDLVHASVTRLSELLGGPVPRAIVMEPRWLAAAVILKTKPFLYPYLQESDDSGEPYFAPGAFGDARVSRVVASTRRQLDAVLVEPRSLAEKVRNIASRLDIPQADVITVTTFLPPVTHSREALVRYYCSDGSSEDTVRQLITARQDAQWKSWQTHVGEWRSTLIIDRQQIEEYFADPEYYQMTLRPDELEEQVEHFLAMLSYEKFRVALCPDAVDLPFTVTGDDVELRGDRRNKSEPRPGRVNGLVHRDPRLAEELRREASSLANLTETNFKDKYFVGQWMIWMASVYRRTVERRAAYLLV